MTVNSTIFRCSICYHGLRRRSRLSRQRDSCLSAGEKYFRTQKTPFFLACHHF